MLRASSACVPFVLVLTACGSGGAGEATAPTCQEPSPALLARITELAPAGSRFTVVGAGGQKATNKASTWWLGVRFTAGGAPVVRTGIWAVGGGLDGRGTILAVDRVAQQWSQALDADTSASKISVTSGAEVLDCL